MEGIIITGKKVYVIRANLLDRETRATKIIKSLTNHRYLVTFLCWDRSITANRTEKNEAGNFHDEVRLKLKAPWGTKMLIYLPVWWLFIFYKLMTTDWDIAHAIQIVSSPPAVIAGKLRRKPVIYDMLDTYEDSIIIPMWIRNILVRIDKIFMGLSSAIILADEAQIEEVGGIPNSNIVIIYDSPEDNVDVYCSKSENDIFSLFFAGLLYSGKALNLDKIFLAVDDLSDIKIVIAGYGDLVEQIREWSQKMKGKMEFIGEINHLEVLSRSAKADLLFMIRSPIVPVNKYICGSKILEAMMCGTPILVNKGTSTSNIVLRENCGLVVDANDIEEIRRAIIKLRDNTEIRKNLGANARKAYEMRYSWEIMEHRLVDLYQELTGEIGRTGKEK